MEELFIIKLRLNYHTLHLFFKEIIIFHLFLFYAPNDHYD